MSRPTLILTLVVALVLSACSGSEAESTTTPPPTTTTSSTTTTTSSTTTTEPPPTTLTLSGDMPQGMLREAELLYNHIIDPANPPPVETSPALAAHLASVSRKPGVADADGSVALLRNGDRVGVLRVRRDRFVMVNIGAGWKIVGAVVRGADPWVAGDPLRKLLVLGSDARVGEDQLGLRADSVHVLTMVPATGEGTFLGFPRDTWVRGSKLTDLMPIGGPDLMSEVITEISGQDLEGWVAVGFEGFLGLIEEIGSLEIDLPEPMRSGNNWDDYPEGFQVLTPQLALRLARIRKGLPAGDFDRSYNQGLVVLAAMTMIQDMGILQLPRWVKAFDTHGFTDLSTEDFVTFATTAYLTSPEKLTNLVVPGVNGTVGAAAVVFVSDSAEAVFRDLDDGVIDEQQE